MDTLTVFLTTPVATNIAVGCFIAAAACMAVHYHRQFKELQKQSAETVAVLRQIAANTQKA